MSRLPALLAAALAACGGSEPEPAAPSADGDSISRVPAETLIVVVIDGLEGARLEPLAGEASPDPVPNLRQLAEGALVFSDHVASSTGLNAGLATLLTGERSSEHGVGSLRQRGLSALPADQLTVTEVLAEQGWATLAALAAPQLDRTLSGLDQGFDEYRTPGVFARRARTVEEVWPDIRPGLVKMLQEEDRVFALIQLSDLLSRDIPPIAEAEPFLRARLAPLVERDEILAGILSRFAEDPAEGVAALSRQFGRGRGSAIYLALAEAGIDVRLALVDRMLGELVSELRESGRWEKTCLVVTSTRGRPPEGSAAGDAMFPAEVARPLLVVRPASAEAGRVAAGVSSADLAASLLAAAGAGGGLGDAAGGGLFAGEKRARICESASLEVAAVFGARHHVEENRIAGTLAFGPRGLRIVREAELSMEDQAELAELRRALSEFREPPRIVLETGGLEVAVRWRFADGFAGPARVAGSDGGLTEARISGVSGAATLTGDSRSLTIEAGRRSQPARLDLDGRGTSIEESAVWIGDLPLSRSRLPRLPGRGEPWPTEASGEPAAARFRVERGSGGWWWLRSGEAVPAGSRVEVVLATYPPDRPDDELDWSAGPEISGQHIAGRSDAAVLSGQAPFEVQVSRSAAQEFALAVLVEGTALPLTSIRLEDRSFSAPDELALYLPDWMAGVTEELEGEDGSRELEPGVVRLLRHESGPGSADRRPLEADVRRAISRLGGGE